MAQKLKHFKHGKGMIYLEIDGNKRSVTLFLKNFLKKFDNRLFELATEKKAINKRKDNYAFFLLGADGTIFILNSHLLIHTDKNDRAIQIIKDDFKAELEENSKLGEEIEISESDRKYTMKRFKRGKGMIYVGLKEGEEGVKSFLRDFLSKFDNELLNLLNTDEEVIFISGENNTLFNVENHILIHANDEDKCINLIESMLDL